MQRPRRTVRAPKRYWDEYVVTDEWYKREMLEDVPPDELKAAIEDSDFSGSESEADGESEDRDYTSGSATPESETDEEAYGTSEGESGGEGNDGESACIPMGEAPA